MKIFYALLCAVALAVLTSCSKTQTEEEKNAEVEKQVQQRLAGERQADDQQKIAQQQADLAAREKALADKEAAAISKSTTTPARPAREVAQPRGNLETTEKRSTASYGTFYRKLEPYGAWRETSDYGYVWQPREAEGSRSWRPYEDGRWVYSDAGWTWVSEEPFGWATYHYGRWTRLKNIGWVWVPGEQWAPAWVSFRKGDDYIGWAPLPPEAHFERGKGIHNWADNYYDIGPEQYSFVRSNQFGSRRAERNILPTEQNVTIVNETTNVTNITYNNTTIMNGGPNYDELRSHSAQPIERYRLERQVEMTGETSRPVVRGEVLEMSTPLIAPVAGMDRPRTVKEKITQSVVENGWAGIADQSAAQKTRAKMKSEATPPPDAPPKIFAKPEPAASVIATPSAPTPAATAVATPAPASTPVSAPTVAPTAVLTPVPASTPVSTPSLAPTAVATPSAAATPIPAATESTPVTTPTAVATPRNSPVPPDLNRRLQQQTEQYKKAEDALKREQFRKAKAKAKDDQIIVPPPAAAEPSPSVVEPANAPAAEAQPTAAPSIPALKPGFSPRPRPARPIAAPSPIATAPADSTPAPADSTPAPDVSAVAPSPATAVSPNGPRKREGRPRLNRPEQVNENAAEPTPSPSANTPEP